MGTPPAVNEADIADRPDDGPARVVTRWPATPRTVGRARRQLRAALDGWDLRDLTDTAELVLSELLTNSVRHARTPQGREIETRYEPLPGGGVRIEVHDACGTWPQVRRPADDAESGRGLVLVDALTAGRWGVASRLGVGKLLWAHVGPEYGGEEAAAGGCCC